MLTIEQLCEIYSLENVKVDRFTSPLRSMKHLASEVIELTDALARNSNSIADEIADVITCAILIANKSGVNLEMALRKNIEKNKRRGWLK